MKNENFIDGLRYELTNKKVDLSGRIVSSEICARADTWNAYSDSSEKMMNRICHQLDPELIPDYNPSYEYLSTDLELNRLFVRKIKFRVAKNNYF